MISQSIIRLEGQAFILNKAIIALNLRFDELHLYIKRHYLVKSDPPEHSLLMDLTPSVSTAEVQRRTKAYEDEHFESIARYLSLPNTANVEFYDLEDTPREVAVAYARAEWEDIALWLRDVEELTAGLDADVIAIYFNESYAGFGVRERLKILNQDVGVFQRLVKRLWEDLQSIPLFYGL